MMQIEGRVTAIGAQKRTALDGSILYDVTIEASGDTLFAPETAVMAQIQVNEIILESAGQGTVTYPEAIVISSQGSGFAEQVYVSEGDYVTAGDLLLKIENTSLESTAKRTLLDRSDLEIRLASQEKDLEDCFIYAPISGVVIEKSHDLYEDIASNSESIMTIAEIETLQLTLMVEENDAAAFETGQTIELSIDDGETITGNVVSVDTVGILNSGAVRYPVRVSIENDGTLLPGDVLTYTVSE
jgi:HlyD family secretion protein